MILAVDLGSTTFKAGIFDQDLNLIGSGEHTLTYSRPRPSQVQLRTDEITRGFEKSICKALSMLPSAESVKAMAITSQAQTFSLAEPRDQPKLPFVSWLDGRAAKTCEGMRQTPLEEDFHNHCSFTTLIPNLQICMLKNLLDSKEVKVSESTLVIPLPSYLVWLLSGTYLLDTNLAAMSGLYSLKEKGWWPAALQACGVSAEQLPQICEIGTVATRTISRAGGLGLVKDIPIVLAGNDQTAGAYSAQIHTQNALLLTLGTAHVTYATCKQIPTLSKETTARGRYPGDRYYVLACDCEGGTELKNAVKALAGADQYEDFFQMVSAKNPGSEEKSNKARAVVEDLVGRIVNTIKAVSPQGSYDKILAAGGGSKHPQFLEMISKTVGKPVEQVETDPLLGAARMAKEAVG